METSGKFINFVIIITVVTVKQFQGTAYGQGKVPCCSSGKTENITECCLCDSKKNCSALDLKTSYTNDGRCILSTTSTEATSALGTTLSESETSTTYTTPPTGKDGGLVTICVSACPGGFYEDQNQTCQRCDELCKNCTMNTCLECTYGRNSSGDCCPNGTRSKDNGNITICVAIPSTPEQPVDDKKNIIIGSFVGGLVVIGLLNVVVCLYCRRQGNGQQGQTHHISRLLELPGENELKSVEESIVTGGIRPAPDENTATLDHRDIARRVQQEQDKIGRYAKDPTGKKKNGHRISKIHRNEEKICIDEFKLPTETLYAETMDNVLHVSIESSKVSTTYVKGNCPSPTVVKLPPPPPPPPPVVPT